jgi:hypothetical protein
MIANASLTLKHGKGKSRRISSKPAAPCGKYASIISDLEIERLSEKEFRDILAQAIRVGGAACIAALKPIAVPQRAEPAKRP